MELHPIQAMNKHKIMTGSAVLASAALIAGGAIYGPRIFEGDEASAPRTMSAEDCAPFMEGLAPVHTAELAVMVTDANVTSGTTPNAQPMTEAEKLRAEAAKKDAEAAEAAAKEAFLAPYKKAVADAQAGVDTATNTTTTEGAPAPSEGDKLRNEAAKKDAETALTAAQETEDKAEKAAEECDPTDTTPTTLPANADGVDPATGHEFKYHIAGEGSCSPYTRADGLKAAAGEYPDPMIDLNDAEVQFLQDNPEFAATMAVSSESHWSFAYDAVNVARPSVNPEGANKSAESLFANEYYVSAPLAEATPVLNTYCDEAGNIIDYRIVTLEAGTYVGGMIVDQEGVNPENGNRFITLKNGKSVEIPGDALVTSVTMPDGSVVRMAAVNKEGVNVDGDFAAEIGCMNWLRMAPPVTEETPGQPGGPDTTGPNRTTTTRGGVTTTTGVTPTTRAQVGVSPNSSVVDGPGTPNTTDGDNNPDNNTTTSLAPAPPTQPTVLPPGPTTTERVAPTIAPTTNPVG